MPFYWFILVLLASKPVTPYWILHSYWNVQEAHCKHRKYSVILKTEQKKELDL